MNDEKNLRYSRADLEKIAGEVLSVQEEGYARDEVLESVVEAGGDRSVANNVIENYDERRRIEKKDLSSKTKEPIEKSVLSVISEDLKKIGKNILYAVVVSVGSIFAVPTTVRVCNYESHDDYLKFVGSVAPVLLNLACFAHHLNAFKNLDNEFAWIGLGVHLGTNLASGIYEGGRAYIKHLKKEVNENPQ